MFSKLPTELLDHVSYYFSAADKVNLSCCNREYRQLLKNILWAKVKFSSDNLSSRQLPGGIFDNLQYTQALVWEYRTAETKSAVFNIGYNLSKCLGCIDSTRLIELGIGGPVRKDAVFFMMRALPMVQYLRLVGVVMGDEWAAVITGSSLKELCISNCDISDNILYSFLEKNKDLGKLKISNCTKLTNDFFWQCVWEIPSNHYSWQ